MSPDLHRAPIYQQIASAIRDRITSGDLQDGQPVPSWQEIQNEWGVAKMTARRAMKELEDEGLILTRSGLPSVVARVQLVRPPGMVADALGVPVWSRVRMQTAPGMVVFRL